jgi:LuxR family quorum sensing-dependent transcriptional regulator
VVSLVGKTDHLDEKGRLELHMLALYAHGRLRYLNGPSGPPVPRRCITPREAEILKWAATGKTAAEIGDITGLTPRTINQHCENAQKRMGTNNRLHTVVEAIRHKLIPLPVRKSCRRGRSLRGQSDETAYCPPSSGPAKP